MGPRALALCLYSLDWAVAAAAAVAVAAVAVAVTNMPIAHYHLENISRRTHLFFDMHPFK